MWVPSDKEAGKRSRSGGGKVWNAARIWAIWAGVWVADVCQLRQHKERTVLVRWNVKLR